MKIYVFGNTDIPADRLAFVVKEKLEKLNPDIQFIVTKPNEDLPFSNNENVVLMDTIIGINKVEIINFEKIDKLINFSRITAHDFDLGFQLKYLKKIGKLGKVTIIGLPQNREIDYERIQSILRKLVAQDIQGS